jgi:sulfite reductase alpha subunit-like flavoprotein
MLTNDKKQILDQIISSFSQEEVLWVSGYLAGFANSGDVALKQSLAIENLTILYVTETGNSKFLASEISKKLKEQNVSAKLKSIEQYRLSDFAKEKNLILISSTHGEGEIPAAGKKFHEYLAQNELDLSALKFLVISLGDHNYPLFCEAGKIFEKRFEELKARKISERIDLDLNFEEAIPQIYSRITEVFGGVKSAQKIAKISSSQSEFEGTILTNINLNDIGSSKQTHHIEISVDNGEANYESGDSIGIKLGDAAPRLYSIASARSEHGNEIHLTVSRAIHIDENGKEGEGLVSGYLSHLALGEKVKFYISRNRSFKLPADNKDIIMVGPGTGIAPFRSFLAERNARNSTGKNWLFFGERNFQSDFLYQVELQDHLASGLLSRLDVAFSRDQEKKIYVQNRIREKAADLYQWLEGGAYFYVCGDKENMARDVENALLELIQDQGEKSAEQAQEFLANLIEEGRYLRDVY